MSITEAEIKEREHRFVTEAFGKGDLDLIDELIATDYVGHLPRGFDDIEGQEGYKEFYTMTRSAFPDLEVTVEDQIAEGNRVAQRNRISGTHEGEFRGIPPTGESVEITGIEIKEYNDDGKAVEGWGQFDYLGALQQLGVVEPPGK